jgi:penicillin-binding protein 1A
MKFNIFLLFIITLLLYSFKVINTYLTELPDLMNSKNNPSRIVIQSINKKSLDFYPHNIYITHNKIPKIIKQAFIAIEDRRFYSHIGIDFVGIFRSILINFAKLGFIQGGSTITQQLSRMLYLKNNKTLKRKIIEALIAIKLNRMFIKEIILEKYLNNIYLGEDVYGISNASWLYFSKKVYELTLKEAAFIAGLAASPNKLSPFRNFKLADERCNNVLRRMNYCKFITIDEMSETIKLKLNIKNSKNDYYKKGFPWIRNFVKNELKQILSSDQIENKCLIIRTSIDYNYQINAQKNISDSLSDSDIEGSLVSIESTTGEIKALIGGTNYKKSQFNRATMSIRQTGSIFKLFVYAAALKNGFKPDKYVIDKKMKWGNYSPKNAGSKYYGIIKLKDALKTSSNSIAVQLTDRLGIDTIISTANDFKIGLKRKLKNNLSIALGVDEQTLISMVAAYTVISNDGNYIKPTIIKEIIDDTGKVIYSNNKETKEKVLDKKVANDLNKMFKYINKDNIIGKTGTTDYNKDLWYIGEDKKLTTGIWCGKDNNHKTNLSARKSRNIWKKFMKSINL